MKKKIIAILLFGAILLTLTACQPTPQERIVISSENSNVVAGSSDSKHSVTEDATEKESVQGKHDWVETITGSNNMQIVANANIKMPEGTYYVIKANPTTFDDDLTSRVVSVLSQGHDLYLEPENGDYIVMSREEVESDIIQVKKDLQWYRTNRPEEISQIGEIEASLQRMEEFYNQTLPKDQLLSAQKKYCLEN